jgi:hypothetical protein
LARTRSAPASGPYWSLMFEISESQYKPVKQDATKLGGTAGTWWVKCREGQQTPCSWVHALFHSLAPCSRTMVCISMFSQIIKDSRVGAFVSLVAPCVWVSMVSISMAVCFGQGFLWWQVSWADMRSPQAAGVWKNHTRNSTVCCTVSITLLLCAVDCFCRPEVVAETIRGAINTKLIEPGTEIVSIYHRRWGAVAGMSAGLWRTTVVAACVLPPMAAGGCCTV